MAEPGDHRATPAGGRGHGHLRASHADREQVIEVLKDAFVQGRLTSDELDSRVGQAYTSRTYAELAAVTADIPAGPAAAPPHPPVHARNRAQNRARNRSRKNHTARDVAIGLILGLIIAATLVLSGITLLLVPLIVPVGLALPLVLLASRQPSSPRGQLPPRPGESAQAPAVQHPGQARNDPVLPPARPDQARLDQPGPDQARVQPGRSPSRRRPARTPRVIDPAAA